MKDDIESEEIKLLTDRIEAKIIDKTYVPLKTDELADVLELDANEKNVLASVLNDLRKHGIIAKTTNGKWLPAKALSIFYGLFTGNPRGYGFVTVEGMPDIFIPERMTGGAIHKDRVLVRAVPNTPDSEGKSRFEGEILEIVERSYKTIVGTYIRDKRSSYVVADEPKIFSYIFVDPKAGKRAQDGHKVVVRLNKAHSGEHTLNGEIVEILGHLNDPGVDVISIVKQYEVPIEFPSDVMTETDRTPDEVTDEDISDRRDLREILAVTIDGDDSKDFDDAVSLEMSESGAYILGVHIADVTHYVREGAPLDTEAYKRGTSIYLADRVIPMLPHKLSNGICSLNPECDRLAISCVMEIDSSGKIVRHEIFKSVINSKKRLTYSFVNELLIDESNSDKGLSAELAVMLRKMGELSEILRKKRIARGAIEFDLPETKIKVDKTGWPTDIIRYERNNATELIEEFMLACNETVAEEFFWLNMPFVYRTHEEPDQEKLKRLASFLSYYGYSLKGGGAHPKSIQSLLAKIKKKPEETVISRVTLRSLKQARYSSDNIGHFGLAAKYYCHFTSPIRRYPDLQIHRIIKQHIENGMTDDKRDQYENIMPTVCNRCTVTERLSESIEREVDNLKKVQFMSDKIGKHFDGIISGLAGWGIYVELPNTVEGMVSVADMDDHYIYDDKNYILVGRHTNKIYKLGDTVKVKLVKANLIERKLAFVFV